MSSRNIKYPRAFRQTVTAGRTVEIIHRHRKDGTTGVAIDLSGSVFSAEIRTAPDTTGTLLGTVDFTGSDLANGVIYGIIAPATATAVEAGATAVGLDGTREAYVEIKEVDSLGRAWSKYKGVLPVEKAGTV